MSDDKKIATDAASGVIKKAPVQSDTEKKAELNRMTQAADRIERTTGSSGAVPLAPKGMLLDASDVSKTMEDKRLRWVNVNSVEKAQGRTAQGYERIPAAEGGRQVGNLALFSLSREAYEQRVAAVAKLGEERLNAHKAEVEQMADAVARELRDRHGIQVNAERIIIRE